MLSTSHLSSFISKFNGLVGSLFLWIFTLLLLHVFLLTSSFLFFPSVASNGECGEAGYNRHRGRIVGGKRSAEGDWPWMAAIHRDGMLHTDRV